MWSSVPTPNYRRPLPGEPINNLDSLSVGLLASYNFNESTGLFLADNSPMGYRGELVGGALGRDGFTVENASTGYARIGVPLRNYVTNKFTMAVLLRIDTVPTSAMRTFVINNFSSYNVALTTKTSASYNTFRGLIYTSSGTGITGSTTMTAGQEYLVVLRYDGANISLFVNGARDATDVAKTGNLGNLAVYQTRIGYSGSTSGYAAGATYKALRMWNRALDDGEIWGLSNNLYRNVSPPSNVWFSLSAGGTTYTGTGTQSQTAQAEALSSLLRFIATGSGNQSSQSEGSASLLRFIASNTAAQSAQGESSSALLRFLASGSASQAPQSEMLAALLSFKGGTAQLQAANSEAIASVLRLIGTGSQTQAAQTQAIYQAISAISGAVTQAQAAQIAALSAALAFRGASAQTQASQSEALAAVLRFAGATTQAQAAQAQALQALLAIRGQVTQSQAIQIAALTAIQILDITGAGTQAQEAQRQAVSDFVEELIAILTITARDPLALTVTDSDPLALDVTVADPLALTITRTL